MRGCRRQFPLRKTHLGEALPSVLYRVYPQQSIAEHTEGKFWCSCGFPTFSSSLWHAPGLPGRTINVYATPDLSRHSTDGIRKHNSIGEVLSARELAVDRVISRVFIKKINKCSRFRQNASTLLYFLDFPQSLWHDPGLPDRTIDVYATYGLFSHSNHGIREYNSIGEVRSARELVLDPPDILVLSSKSIIILE